MKINPVLINIGDKHYIGFTGDMFDNDFKSFYELRHIVPYEEWLKIPHTKSYFKIFERLGKGPNSFQNGSICIYKNPDGYDA